MIYMGGNVPLTITITDAFSPYSNHSASGGTFGLSLWAAIQVAISFLVRRCMGTRHLAPASLVRSLWRANRGTQPLAGNRRLTHSPRSDSARPFFCRARSREERKLLINLFFGAILLMVLK